MNVIFLDFNGVLDTYENMDEINEENLQRLKYIVDETNARVVISSSLKNSYYYTGRFSEHLKNIIKEIQSVGIDIINTLDKKERWVANYSGKIMSKISHSILM